MLNILWKNLEDNTTLWLDYIPTEWQLQDGWRKNVRHLTFVMSKSIDAKWTIYYDSAAHHDINAKNFLPGRSIVWFEDDGRTKPLPDVQLQQGETPPETAAEIVYDEGLGPEGADRMRQHKSRERNSKYAKLAKDKRFAETGKLACETCTFDFFDRYGELGFGYIEAHHKEPIADGERITSVEDFSIVCANCHRMIHRSASSGEMITASDLREKLNRAPPMTPVPQPS